MAQELTANFGANSTKFSKGVQEIKAQITELNKAYVQSNSILFNM